MVFALYVHLSHTHTHSLSLSSRTHPHTRVRAPLVCICLLRFPHRGVASLISCHSSMACCHTTTLNGVHYLCCWGHMLCRYWGLVFSGTFEARPL